MTDYTERVTIRRLTGQGGQETEDILACEAPVTIILNGRELATLPCSPVDLEYLALGFLFSEGLIGHREDVKELRVRPEHAVTIETRVGWDSPELPGRMVSSAGGRLARRPAPRPAPIESAVRITTPEIFRLMADFESRSEVYRTTGGLHGAGLCDRTSILAFSEDVGRHNAIDKVYGECLLKGIPTADHILLTSGRVSSEVLLKVARGRLPILVSKSAPTSLGVRLARELGVTVFGFARGERVNLYTHGERLVASEGAG